MKQHRIDFGGHTVTHPYLSRLSRERMQWEVSECKSRIEAELQAPVVHFAYPNGRCESTDRLELRRGQAWEQDEALFAYKMDWYQLVNG
jgi:peptidoglycan/xylan/chitin deacetylase (PgdA/CDA1 family)